MRSARSVIVLDAAMGTDLEARGFALYAPAWSAAAVERAPELVAAIHADYAAAGAQVHTACTFRTTRRAVGDAWQSLAVRAVAIVRDVLARANENANASPRARIAASIAPVEDCYRPDLSPAEALARHAHRETARALAEQRVDILLCETFPHAIEARVAVEEAVASGVETWVALTAGPDASLMSPLAMRDAARACVDAGARAVLVSCVAASLTLPFVRAIADGAGGHVPIGAYANAGAPPERMGWSASDPLDAATRYVEHARQWIDAGATIVGGCCGTGVAHVAALAALARTTP